MKILIILLSLAVLQSCSNRQGAKTGETVSENHKDHSVPSLQLNNGKKWKADQATQNNVDALKLALNDPRFANGENTALLKSTIQAKIDTLVSQCRMKGPDHDALHVWLTHVLNDLKRIDEEPGENGAAYVKLKEDVESFYQFFE